MPVTEQHTARALTLACQTEPPRRVARCLFGRPDPEELDRMEAEIAKETREHALQKYGVDLEELSRREDIDTLVVRCLPETEQVSDVTASLHTTTLLQTSAEVDLSNEMTLDANLSNKTPSNVGPSNGTFSDVDLSNVTNSDVIPSNESNSDTDLSNGITTTMDESI